ncbi:MAG: hypothetical protein AAGH40_10460 [Verrucomicrobiota bacterium]
MELIKKNLVFFIIVGVAVLISLVGIVLSVLSLGSVGDAKKKVSGAESSHRAVLDSPIAPTQENVDASISNIEDLTDQLGKIRSDLERGAKLSVTEDSIGVMASVQQYIAKFRSAAKNHTDSAGEPSAIEVPADFAFGFSKYVDQTSVSDTPGATQIIDKQRQVLDFVLDKLIAADPYAINEILREEPEVVLTSLEKSETAEIPAQRRGSSANTDKGFYLQPPVSARVPGAINTLAFSISFTSYTSTLRELINEMAKFELPLVLRSIEVERPTDAGTTASVANEEDELSALFGLFGADAESPEDVTEAIEQKPVVEDTVSTFTVIFEFIEVALPEQEESERA